MVSVAWAKGAAASQKLAAMTSARPRRMLLLVRCGRSDACRHEYMTRSTLDDLNTCADQTEFMEGRPGDARSYWALTTLPTSQNLVKPEQPVIEWTLSGSKPPAMVTISPTSATGFPVSS